MLFVFVNNYLLKRKDYLSQLKGGYSIACKFICCNTQQPYTRTWGGGWGFNRHSECAYFFQNKNMSIYAITIFGK